MRDLTLFEALTGGAFDRLNWQHSGEFDQNFSQKSNARGFARGGGGAWAVLELSGTLHRSIMKVLYWEGICFCYVQNVKQKPIVPWLAY